MTLYARLNDAGTVERTVDLTPAQYADLQANGKAAWLRAWAEDAKPTPTAGEVLVDTGITVTATEARQTWGVRAKTQAELDADASEAERTHLRTVITNLAASVSSPDTTGTAGERIVKLEARTLRLERIALWLLRRFT